MDVARSPFSWVARTKHVLAPHDLGGWLWVKVGENKNIVDLRPVIWVVQL